MKPTFLSLYIIFLLGCVAWSQETHVIDWHPGVQADLQINVGDTVKWFVSQEGAVDVHSTNGLPNFGSAPLEGAGSLYEYVFKTPGKINFYSSTNPKSMRGSIEVGKKAPMAQDDLDFEIYPNPVKDRIFFDNDLRSDNLDVTIYDVLGKVVKKDKLTPLTIRNGMDVSALKRGVYLVQIDNASNSFTQKLIKN